MAVGCLIPLNLFFLKILALSINCCRCIQLSKLSGVLAGSLNAYHSKASNPIHQVPHCMECKARWMPPAFSLKVEDLFSLSKVTGTGHWVKRHREARKLGKWWEGRTVQRQESHSDLHIILCVLWQGSETRPLSSKAPPHSPGQI